MKQALQSIFIKLEEKKNFVISSIVAITIALLFLSINYHPFISLYITLTIILILLTGFWYGSRSFYLIAFLIIIFALFSYMYIGIDVIRTIGYAISLFTIAIFVSMHYEYRLMRDSDFKDVNEKFLQLAQRNPIPTFIIDKNHKITYWNDSMKLLTGLHAFEMVGTTNQWSAFHKEKRPVLADIIVDGANNDIMYKYYNSRWKKVSDKDIYEVQILQTINGIDRFLMIVASPIKDSNMNVVGAIQTIYDITEQKKAENLIKQAEIDAEWRESFNSIDDPMIVLNKDLIIIEINKSAKKMEKVLGNMVGKTNSEFFSKLNIKEEDRTSANALKTKKPVTQIVDLSSIGLGISSVKSTPILNKDNEVTKIITIVRDITKELQMEKEKEKLLQELEYKNKELEYKNKELEDFTHTISHDFQSPLITIEGFANILKENLIEGTIDDNIKYLNHISDSADKMRFMMDETLKLSKMGKFISAPEEIPYDHIVQEALDFMQGEILKNNAQISKTKNFPIVCVDKIRIRELLTNLIGNSIKYSKENEIPIIEIGYIKNAELNKSDGFEVFFVRDDGIGISKENQEKIFELFYRVDDKNIGSGVGMPIVRKIVESHGGKIWIESELGKGTTVFYTLPVKSNREFVR